MITMLGFNRTTLDVLMFSLKKKWKALLLCAATLFFTRCRNYSNRIKAMTCFCSGLHVMFTVMFTGDIRSDVHKCQSYGLGVYKKCERSSSRSRVDRSSGMEWPLSP